MTAIDNLQNNIVNTTNCFGCGVCALACPKDIIVVSLNKDGFYEPRIFDEDQCVHCGACLKVCSFHNQGLSTSNPVLKSYGAWSKDDEIRKACSSGGVGYELGKEMLAEGGKVCGVRYNVEKGIAEHFVACDEEELKQTIGSKYIQSNTVDGFKAIDLNKKYFVVGTPCQIDSFRRYLKLRKKEDNFFLLDFFCHGTPSMLAWRSYCKMIEAEIGPIKNVAWRDKHYGWHDSWNMRFNQDNDGTSQKESRWTKGDVFYRLFLGDYCMNPACHKDCKYKFDRSAADIRIGDAWGTFYNNNQDGVSSLVAFTEKGLEYVDIMQNSCEIEELPFETVAEDQMTKNCGKAYTSYCVMHILRKGAVMTPRDWKRIFQLESALRFPKRVMNYIKRKI